MHTNNFVLFGVFWHFFGSGSPFTTSTLGIILKHANYSPKIITTKIALLR